MCQTPVGTETFVYFFTSGTPSGQATPVSNHRTEEQDPRHTGDDPGGRPCNEDFSVLPRRRPVSARNTGQGGRVCLPWRGEGRGGTSVAGVPNSTKLLGGLETDESVRGPTVPEVSGTEGRRSRDRGRFGRSPDTPAPVHRPSQSPWSSSIRDRYVENRVSVCNILVKCASTSPFDKLLPSVETRKRQEVDLHDSGGRTFGSKEGRRPGTTSPSVDAPETTLRDSIHTSNPLSSFR